MAKSKYPNKLDTSLEIPAVRDNIIEVGSDVLNSLRSAIFNIERTLGINPQGAIGNTVASRLNNAIDGNGNIVKEALDKANLLSGPIKNLDVSKSAGIEESKLKLNFPTNLLQSEISQAIKQIDIITKTLEDLAYLFAAHTHPAAKNRHMAQAISVEEIPVIASDVGMISTERKTSQEFYESLFSSHINFTGSGISDLNRSHRANQIFFNKDSVSAYVSSDDVQGAIEDTLSQTLGQLEGHQDLHHSNGVLRSSLNTNSSFDQVGEAILLDQEVLFFKSSPEETARISNISLVNDPEFPPQGLRKSDTVRLYSEDGSHQDFQLHSFSKTGDELGLDNIKVFGFFERNSLATDRVSIFRNENTSDDASALTASARPYPDQVNLDLIQVANPSAPKIITKGIRPSEISSTNRYFKILIDDSKEVSLDAYDVSVVETHDLESIISSINKDLCASGASVLAYRVDFDDERHSEIAFVHSLASSATENISLEIKEGDVDDCLSSMGLSSFKNISVRDGSSSQYYIQGKAYSGLGFKLEQSGLVLIAGTSSISSQAIGLDLKEQGIYEGDLIVISGTDSDDGTYVITDVSSSTLTVDRDQLDGKVWSGVEGPESIFRVLSSTVSLAEFEFYKPTGASGSGAIVDLFLDSNKNIFYNTRLEYPIKTFGASGSLISPCNFDGDVFSYTNDSPGIISAELNEDNIPQVRLDGGPIITLDGISRSYITLDSGSYNLSVRAYIESSDNIFSKLDNEGPFEIELYGDIDVNLEENLMIARATFDSSTSRIIGGKQNNPRFFKLIQRGVTSDKDLSSQALKKTYQTPFNETRSNGVVEGLRVEVPDVWDVDGVYAINLTGGVCYVKGKRFSIDKKYDLVSGINKIDADKVFIAINEWGEVVFGGANSSGGTVSCSSPFDSDSYCILSCLEYAAPNTPNAIDLRLNIRNLDLKVLNPITVSPKKGMGHFQNFGEAVKYAKRFVDVFPEAGTPTIHLKAGTHKVSVDVGVNVADYQFLEHYAQAAYDAGVYINFPVNIVGEGDSTVLDIFTEFLDQTISSDDRQAAGDSAHAGHLFIAGSGVAGVDGDLSAHVSGEINISSLKMGLTSISVVDPLIRDEDDNILNSLVSCDGVTFDFGGKALFGQHNSGFIVYKSNNSDVTDEVGNLIIRNCSFINCHIDMSRFDDSSHKNILVIGNLFRGNGSEGDNENIYAFRGIKCQSFDDVPVENNFEIRANLLAGDLAGHADAGARLSDSGMWSERISSNLRIGRQVSIGGNGHLTEGLDKNYGIVLRAKRAGEDGNGIFITDGQITSSKGNLKLIDGDIELVDGNIDVTDGHVTLSQGNVVVTDGNAILSDGNLVVHEGDIIMNDGDLRVNDGRVYFSKDLAACQVNIMSTADTDNSGGELLFRRNPGVGGSLSSGWNLGEIRFGGYEGDPSETSSSSSNGDVAIIAEVATDTWDKDTDRGALLDFYTTPAGGTGGKKRVRIAADGKLLLSGGSDINGSTTEASGTLLIGNSSVGDAAGVETDDWTTLKHLSLDSNEIQARGDNLAPGTLYLNVEGGTTYVGSETYNGTGMIVRNKDQVSNEVRSTLSCENYKNDNINISSILSLQFKEISSSNLDYSGSFDGDTFIRFRASNGTIGSVNADQNTVSFNPFTGQHIAPISDDQIDLCNEIGKIVSSDGTTLIPKNISESFSGAKLSCSANDKSVYGVIARTPWAPSDEEWLGFSPGQYAVTVNSLGNGRVWVTNIAGDIEVGDYITSSDIPGFGQLQADDILHNYTVAKAVEAINWNLVTDVISYNGVQYKKCLIACTYHCG